MHYHSNLVWRNMADSPQSPLHAGHLLLNPFELSEELREKLVIAFLCQLEGVSQTDSAIWQVSFTTGYLMEHRFYVHISYIIGQQHDFIAMDFIKILCAPYPQGRIRPDCNNRVMNIPVPTNGSSICTFCAVSEVLNSAFKNVIHRTDDEVHALYGRINNAQFFHCKRECAL